MRIAGEGVCAGIGDARDIMDLEVEIAKEIQPPYLPLREVMLCFPMNERIMVGENFEVSVSQLRLPVFYVLDNCQHLLFMYWVVEFGRSVLPQEEASQALFQSFPCVTYPPIPLLLASAI